MRSPEEEILKKVESLQNHLSRPVVVALDGGSGAGKTTIAERLARLTSLALVPLDQFYQTRVPEREWATKSVEERLNGVFEWERVRVEAIGPLVMESKARWRAFDFSKGLGPDGTYSLKKEFTEVISKSTILVEGAYSASPFLRDMIDLAVVLDVPPKVRHERVAARDPDSEDFRSAWHAVWDDVEHFYFSSVCPPSTFDLVLKN
jgi:para-aminobenzoate synthetase